MPGCARVRSTQGSQYGLNHHFQLQFSKFERNSQNSYGQMFALPVHSACAKKNKKTTHSLYYYRSLQCDLQWFLLQIVTNRTMRLMRMMMTRMKMMRLTVRTVVQNDS